MNRAPISNVATRVDRALARAREAVRASTTEAAFNATNEAVHALMQLRMWIRRSDKAMEDAGLGSAELDLP